MEHVAQALQELEKALKKANGRRRKRRLSSEQILRVPIQPQEDFKIVRDLTIDGSVRRGRFFRHKRQGRVTAALMFRRDEKIHAVIRSFVCTRQNGFTDLIWGGKWRKKADPFDAKNVRPIWIPSPDDLLIYSDYLEERGLRRVA